MANLEVLALDTAVPQIRAPGAGDGYSVPRDMTFASGTVLSAPTVDATNVEVTNVKAKDGTAAIVISDTTGNVGIGGTASAFSKVEIAGTLPTSSNTSIANYVNATIPSGTTSNHYGFLSNPATQAASFTLTNSRHFHAQQGTIGAGSAITNQYGFFAASSLTGATNNYGFYSAIDSGTNRWNFYAAGTADNYFAGNVLIAGDVAVTRANPRIRFNNTASTASTLLFGADSGSVFLGAETNAPIYFITNNTERMRITSSGNIVAGASAALATTATDGFLYVPTCAGTPTGTPTAITGMAPIVVDTTNNKLYFYSGGQWRDAGP